MCVHFFNFNHLRITLQSSDLVWGTKFHAPSLLLPPLIFSSFKLLSMTSYGGELVDGVSNHLRLGDVLEVVSPIIFLPSPLCWHDLQEEKDSIDEEDPRPTSSTWSYIMWYQKHLRLGDVLLLPLSFCSVNSL